LAVSFFESEFAASDRFGDVSEWFFPPLAFVPFADDPGDALRVSRTFWTLLLAASGIWVERLLRLLLVIGSEFSGCSVLSVVLVVGVLFGDS